MNGLVKMLLTAGIGAGVMYFYDPRSGDRRRALMRDQIMSARGDAEEFMDKAVVDLRNRAEGLKALPTQVRDRTASRQMDLTDAEGNLTPGIRLLLAGGGGLLALYGRGRGGVVGSALSMGGLGLAARGIANTDFRRLIGVGGVKDAVQVTKAISIDVSPEELYSFWQNFENFPRFMANIKEIKRLSEDVSHWVVEGPAGSTVEWDALTTEQEPNRRITWESTSDSTVKSTGYVRFDPNNRGGTRVTVHMSYTPPAGAIGHAVASLLGKNPKQQMDEDLMRLKSLMETGKTTTHGQTTTRQDLTGATGSY
jgi:uncharacterized membrane protein